MPPSAKSVTRPSRWGNPFRVGDLATVPALDPQPGFERQLVRIGPHTAVEKFREHAEAKLAEEPDWLEPLRGYDLACYCAEDAEWCHADVLLDLANRQRPEAA